MTKLRVFLGEDHAVVREGLKRLIESESDLQVVGEAADGGETVQKVLRLRPDIVVIDVSMPVLNGLQATRQIKAACPQIKVLALTVHEDRGYVREMLTAGADGYLLKRAAAAELIATLRAVKGGGVHLDPRVMGNLVAKPGVEEGRSSEGVSSLTQRESAVIRRIALGYSNKEIAADLKLSVKTVETYKARAMEKAGLRSRVDIVRLGTERGWFLAEGAALP